ncbi:hypothetical protein EC991_009749 [Linnemannia zychae]|nr:hypothetical protein EC991_009749 [Linnemannia zychae]
MNQQPVNIQVINLDEQSQWIWISSAGANPLQQQQTDVMQGGGGAGGAGAGGGKGGAGSGAFGDLAMAMPAFRAGQTPVSSTLLGNPIDETAASIARRLATKYKRQFLVNLDIPASVDNAMVLAFAERKLVDMLRIIAETVAARETFIRYAENPTLEIPHPIFCEADVPGDIMDLLQDVANSVGFNFVLVRKKATLAEYKKDVLEKYNAWTVFLGYDGKNFICYGAGADEVEGIPITNGFLGTYCLDRKLGYDGYGDYIDMYHQYPDRPFGP